MNFRKLSYIKRFSRDYLLLWTCGKLFLFFNICELSWLIGKIQYSSLQCLLKGFSENECHQRPICFNIYLIDDAWGRGSRSLLFPKWHFPEVNSTDETGNWTQLTCSTLRIKFHLLSFTYFERWIFSSWIRRPSFSENINFIYRSQNWSRNFLEM